MTKMMSFKYDWNKEIICQFYATLYFDADAQKLVWMTVGQQYEITVRGFADLLGLEHQLEMPPEARIHTFGLLKLDDMQFIYALGAEAHPPKVLNFRPELNTLHRLLHATLAPRIGDSFACPQYEWNLIQFYVQKKKFSVFDYILQEIISISRTAFRSCGYAPQIMMMFERISGIDFLNDHKITDLKPQFPARPILIQDVSSSSAPPPSTRSDAAAPPTTSASSSSGSVLRILKSMFAWCRDTRQRQDVLLSNQRRQNEKLGIDEFDEFPLPMPPLDDDPFTSLSAVDLATMEATPDDDEEASDSEYEEDDDDDDDDDE
jgi:hypothetical protein